MTDLSKEFYFCAFEIDDEIQVAITPKVYFDEFGYMFDSHIAGYDAADFLGEDEDMDNNTIEPSYLFIDVEEILPPGWDEVMEGFFEPNNSEFTVAEVEKLFLECGFIQSDEFDKVIHRGLS